jgi:hypothetical protein
MVRHSNARIGPKHTTNLVLQIRSSQSLPMSKGKRNNFEALLDPQSFQAALQLKKLRRAWGEYITQYRWSHWVTLTFDDAITIEKATRYLLAFTRGLEMTVRRRVEWTYCTEGDGVRRRIHIHVVISGAESLSTTRIAAHWKQGLSKVEVFDPRLGAAYYIAKEMWEPNLDNEYNLSKYLPPFRGVLV